MIASILGRAGGIVRAISGKYLWAAIGVLVTLVGVQSCRLQEAREDVGQARANHQAALQAAANNEAAALDLAERLRAEVERNKMDRLAAEKATQALENRLAAINRRTNEERQARDEIYATDEDCAMWRSQPVCPAIADRLRNTRPGGQDD